MVKLGCVYRLTCPVNKKKYIGETDDFHKRMNKHKCPSHNPDAPISKAIQKHGWDAFKPEIVVDGIPTKKDRGKLENYYIEAENTLVPHGYNVQKNRWGVSFDKRDKRWKAHGRHGKHIGRYFTKEKAKRALKLYKSTGERMESDLCTRKKGTGTIRKTKENRYQAQITINKKRYCKTFDTPEQCEAWLEKTRSDM